MDSRQQTDQRQAQLQSGLDRWDDISVRLEGATARRRQTVRCDRERPRQMYTDDQDHCCR